MENELSDKEIDEILDLHDNSTEIPDWASEFKRESVEKMTQFDINPSLHLELNKVYNVIILEPPFCPKDREGKEVKIDGRKLFKMVVDFEGMVFDLLCSNSMLFKMEVYRTKNNLESKDFVGKQIALQKSISKINNKRTNIIEVQFK